MCALVLCWCSCARARKRACAWTGIYACSECSSYTPSLTHTPSPTPLPIVPRLVTTYSPHYTSLLTSLRKHWYLVQNDPLLSALFPTPPQLCFRRNPTLADSLMKASLPGSHRPPQGQVPPIPIPRLDSRMVRCADNRCKVCTKIEGRRVLFSMVSNTPYTFHETFTCTDTCLIYCILCNKCGKLYIGLTSNSLKVRFHVHRHASKTKKLVRPVYRHMRCLLGNRTTSIETIGSFL